MEMINENVNFKVDAAGRVVIPASLRKKYNINPGDRVEYYTTQYNEKTYITFKKMEENNNE